MLPELAGCSSFVKAILNLITRNAPPNRLQTDANQDLPVVTESEAHPPAAEEHDQDPPASGENNEPDAFVAREGVCHSEDDEAHDKVQLEQLSIPLHEIASGVIEPSMANTNGDLQISRSSLESLHRFDGPLHMVVQPDAVEERSLVEPRSVVGLGRVDELRRFVEPPTDVGPPPLREMSGVVGPPAIVEQTPIREISTVVEPPSVSGLSAPADEPSVLNPLVLDLLNECAPKTSAAHYHSRSESCDNCSICLAAIPQNSSSVRITACHHVFHSSCLEEWIMYAVASCNAWESYDVNRNGDVRLNMRVPDCPNCKAHLPVIPSHFVQSAIHEAYRRVFHEPRASEMLDSSYFIEWVLVSNHTWIRFPSDLEVAVRELLKLGVSARDEQSYPHLEYLFNPENMSDLESPPSPHNPPDTENTFNRQIPSDEHHSP